MSTEKIVNGIVGKRIPIRDAALKATGQLMYVADMKLPRMLHAKVLFSPIAHAKIKRIDLSKAEALPGVRAVICHTNSPDIYFNSCGEVINRYQMERIFDDTVRYVGDKVAAVAADTEEIAKRALQLIEVEYEPLLAHFDAREGMTERAAILHDTPDLYGGNIIEKVVQQAGDPDAAMERADRVYVDHYSFPAIHHGAIETHACLADYDAMGKLTIFTSSQDSFAVRINLAKIFQLPMSRVRVVVPAIGGAFGGKIDMMLEHVAALLSMRAGRPVKLVYSRAESIVSTRTRHAMDIELKTGVMLDGTVVAQDFKVYCNAGAYACGSSNVVWAMCGRIFKVHKNPNIRFTGYPVLTNSPIGGPMRGFGSPQIFYAQQRQMNRIAKDLRLEIADMQLANLILPDGMDMRFRSRLGNPRPLDCLEKALELSNYSAALVEQKQTAGERYRIGVGLGVGAHGNGMFGVMTDSTALMLKMNDDGSCTLFSGSHDMGNASISLQAQLVSEGLGVSLDRIACVAADTESTGYHLGDYSSRGAYVSGHAAVKLAEGMRREIDSVARDLFEGYEGEFSFHDDAVYTGNGQSASMEQLVQHARHRMGRELVCAKTFVSEALPTSYGAHIAKVRVDTQTGAVELLEYTAVHDVGKALNPLSVEGQIEGAIQMGVGYALTEEMRLDENGKCLHGSLRRYRMASAKDMPKTIRVALVEQIEETGPYGAKSIGECSVVPTISAIGNAISNAIDREFNELPITTSAIVKALTEKS